MSDKETRLREWIVGQPPPAEELRRIKERLKELKNLRRRVAKLEKQHERFINELSARRAGALLREQEFIKRIEDLEHQLNKRA
jgi:hypothetical protein